MHNGILVEQKPKRIFFGIIVGFVSIDGCDNMRASVVGVKYRFDWIFQFFALFFLNSVRFCAVEKLTYEF